MIHLVFFFLLGGCLGVTIVSDVPRIAVINGVLVQKRQITYRCTQADSGVAQLFYLDKANSTRSNMTISCKAPEFVYPKTLVGYVPKDGRLFVSRFCRAPNRFAYNTSSDSSWDLFEANDMSRKKRQGVVIPRGLTREEGIRYSKMALKNKMFEAEDVMSANFFGLSLTRAVKGLSRVRLKPADFERFKKASDDRLEALEKFEQATAKWETSTTETVLELRSETEQLAEISQAMVDTTRQALTVHETEKNFNAMMFEALGRDLTAANLVLEDARQQQIIAVEKARLALDSGVTDITVSISGISNITLNYKEAMDNNVLAWSKALRKFDERLRQIGKEMRDYSGDLSDSISRVQDYQGLTKLVHEAIDDANTNTDFTPFLKDTGTPPSSYLGPFKNVLVDTIRLMYRTDAGLLILEDNNYYCNATSLVGLRSSWNNFRDILAAIGPVGCTPGNPLNVSTDADGTCLCWMEIKRSYCTQLDNTLGNQFLASDSLNASAVCLNGVVGLTVVSPVIYDNSTSLMTYFTSTRCAQVSSGDFYLKSYRANAKIKVEYASLQCNRNLEDLFDSSSSTLNYVYAFFELLKNSYEIARANFRYYEDIIYGVMPDGLTTRDYHFERENGQSVSCAEAAFVAYSDDMLAAYRLDYLSSSTSTTVTVDGSSKTSDNLISTPAAFQVLPSAYKIIGNPGGYTVYDLYQPDISYAPLLTSRALTPSYYLSDDNRPPNITKVSGQFFNAYDAAYFAKLGECTVDPDTFLCTCPYNPASGTWCTILENYLVTDNGNGAIILSPNEWSFEADVDVDDGVITKNLLFQCPSVNIELVSGRIYQAAITNNAVTDIVVRIEESGPCPKTTPEFSVPKGGVAMRYNIAPCLSGNMTKTISFLYWNVTSFAYCPGLRDLDVTIIRNDFISIGRPDVQYVDVRAVTEIDKMSLAIAASVKNLATIIADRTLSSVVRNSVIGIDISSTVMTQLSGSLDLLSDITRFVNKTLAEALLRNSYNYSELITNHYEEVTEIMKLSTAQNRTITLINKLVQQRELSTQEFLDLQIDALNVNLTRRILLEAEKEFTNSLIGLADELKNSINSAISDGECDSALISWACDLVSFIYNDIVKRVVKEAWDLKRKAMDFVKGVFNTAADFFGALLRMLPVIIMLIVILVVAWKGIAFILARRLDKDGAAFKALFPNEQLKKTLRERITALKKRQKAIKKLIVVDYKKMEE